MRGGESRRGGGGGHRTPPMAVPMVSCGGGCGSDGSVPGGGRSWRRRHRGRGEKRRRHTERWRGKGAVVVACPFETAWASAWFGGAELLLLAAAVGGGDGVEEWVDGGGDEAMVRVAGNAGCDERRRGGDRGCHDRGRRSGGRGAAAAATLDSGHHIHCRRRQRDCLDAPVI
ncbi:hypothetical protein BS78_03G308700 [Paspalum vaginatum]|nr:hypothetical protein BS78_03G308700 [Paspalum vaginatum]